MGKEAASTIGVGNLSKSRESTQLRSRFIDLRAGQGELTHLTALASFPAVSNTGARTMSEQLRWLLKVIQPAGTLASLPGGGGFTRSQLK